MGEFVYKPDKKVTFEAYFQRYEEILKKKKNCNSQLGKKCDYYRVINKNIQGVVFTFQYTMAMLESYKERKWGLHNFGQYSQQRMWKIYIEQNNIWYV